MLTFCPAFEPLIQGPHLCQSFVVLAGLLRVRWKGAYWTCAVKPEFIPKLVPALRQRLPGSNYRLNSQSLRPVLSRVNVASQ